MIWGVLIFILAMIVSYYGQKKHIGNIKWRNKFSRFRKNAVIFVFFLLFPAIIIEKQTGWISTWELSIFGNFWEWTCFTIGIYLPDKIIKQPLKLGE